MSTTTYGGVMREVPIVPFAVAPLSTLVAGMVAQWNASTHVVEPWSVGSNVALGVCTGDADLDRLIVAVYCAKGSSVRVKCAVGIIPNPGDFLFWSASGVVAITGTAGQAFARAIGVGLNGFVEAVII
jgi:hypothetical protein